MGERGVKNPEKHVNCVLLRIKQIEIPYETIHKQRRQFFWIFDTPFPHVGSFLVLSVGNFDQFLTPPNYQRRLWTAPLQMVLLSIAINKLPCS